MFIVLGLPCGFARDTILYACMQEICHCILRMLRRGQEGNDMIGKSVLVIAGIIVILAIAIGLYASGIEDQLMDGGGGGGISANMAEVVIKSDSGWSANIKDSQSRSHVVEGFGDRTLPITCNNDSTYSLTVQKTNAGSGTLNVKVQTDGSSSNSSSQRSSTTSSDGIISLSGTC